MPDRNPRTLCACQPVAFISSASVAPLGRFSRSSTSAVLLPLRASVDLAFFAPLGAFFAGLAFLPDLPFFGATWRARALAPAFLVAFGCSAVAVAAVS